MKILKIFLSYKFVIFMLGILALGAGVATFIESAYDTQTAKILVYDAHWYELVMALLCISLIAIITKTKMWRNLGLFALHLSFVVIALGAFMTRYLGEEGILHLRVGENSDEMLSVKPYLNIITEDKNYEFHLNLSRLGNNDFTFIQDINGSNLILKFVSYIPADKGKRSTLNLSAKFDNEQSQELSLKGGVGWLGEPQTITHNGKNIMLAWGAKILRLPFAFRLEKFELKRYPGSQSASSYASFVTLLHNGEEQKHEISMNNPLNYSGYKFFQSSYDTDELGTILEVNRDPGKIPTYIGYFLLCVGFVLNLFSKHSRFIKLSKFLKNANLLLIFCLLLGSNLIADDFAKFDKNTKEHATKEFATLLVQDYMGRIKPASTLSWEVVSKISGKYTLFGLSPEQIVLGISTDPYFWQDQKIIKVKNAEIKQILGLGEDENFVSFSFMFNQFGEYKLAKQSDAANAKSPSKRSKFDNEIIKFDERVNIAYLALKGVFFRFVPVPNDTSDTWLSPNDAFTNFQINESTKNLLSEYIDGLKNGIQNNDWQRANHALAELKNYQHSTSAHILPSDQKIKAEVLYNKLEIFKNLLYFYMILGLFCFVFGFGGILANKDFKKLSKFAFYLLIFGFLAHAFGLALRWYISGHAPWSDSYESMIYIGFSSILAGLLFFRSSLLTISASTLLASVIMLVAHMSFVNPQITNLVPVLKSYWLSIHVSVITASYGFLGLSALLGFTNLLLMAFKNSKNSTRLNAQIRYLCAIDEIALIVGLSMLSIGNFFGAIWANESWGRYWGWDSKETWSYVSIIVYAIVLHLRLIPKFNGIYTFSVASLLAFFSIIMTYFGVNFYLSGLHSYASGDSIDTSNLLYFVLIALALLIAFAYKGRDIKAI
ncbi:MAG: cytochrome c biogenesis protein CcsA [Campylobacter sp.]|nr:cytochrome c biogenesis protein CcsA [Campylobacter sp.]